MRRLSIGAGLRMLAQMQTPSGGFLENVLLTSFVVLGLASAGRTGHNVVRRGVGFLLNTLRQDGSWPLDTNMTVWNTTLSVGALAAASGDVGALGCLDWLLAGSSGRSRTEGVPQGGWSWTDAPGAPADADDTAGAVLALKVLSNSGRPANRRRIEEAVAAGIDWLLAGQNPDGGWPSFRRGRGYWPFDASGSDVTAHVLRAIYAWQDWFSDRGIDVALRRGLQYLDDQQQPDGRWVPQWFGNQHHVDDENPVYGTAQVILAYRDLGRLDRGAGPAGFEVACRARRSGRRVGGGTGHASERAATGFPSVEETALAVEALLADRGNDSLRPVLNEGLAWLAQAIQEQRHRQAAPIGLGFARLWYYERVYPLAFTVAALGQAVRQGSAGAEGDAAAIEQESIAQKMTQ